MEEIDLFLDNDNSLEFNVSIESSKQFDASCRLMIEGKEMSYSFPGRIESSGDVSITVPSMKGVLKEGKYETSLEIIVDDRIFKPLEFVSNFENSVSVKAEHSVKRKNKSLVTATATFKSPGRKSKVLKEAPKPPPVRKASKPAGSRSNKDLAVERKVKALKDQLKKKNVDLTSLSENQLRQFILENLKK